jgi:hypothetical protein
MRKLPDEAMTKPADSERTAKAREPQKRNASYRAGWRDAEKQWQSWGVVEVAVRNPQVADYCKHWEERVERAESERSSAIKEASADIRTQLLEVAAKVARGVYMPDIDNCRNIREARAVIERADAMRVGLTFELNKILKLLDGGER